jgi:tRNA G18 (ribose-2'-O)-methylase SpoU
MAGHIPVTHPDDPAIAEFRMIRERDLVGRQNKFIVEGSVVLSMLAAAHAKGGAFRAEKLLILDRKLPAIASILDQFPGDIPVYVADAAVLDSIVGFHLHRGILALGQRVESLSQANAGKMQTGSSLVLAGFGLSNHDNMGALFRNAAAFGVNHVFLDATSCDPLYRKALRVSVGSVLTVPWSHGGDASAILRMLADQGYEIWGLSPQGEIDIRAIRPSSRVALIVGTEGEGLSPAILSAIRTARIPQVPGLDSLNVGTATGIALFHVASAMTRF